MGNLAGHRWHWNIWLLIFWGCWLNPRLVWPAVKNCKILNHTANDLTLEFSPAGWNLDTIQLADGKFLKISFDDAFTTIEPEMPALPYTTYLIGIPEQTTVQAEILESHFREIHGYLPIVVQPLQPPRDSAPPTSRDTFSKYRDLLEYPASIVGLDAPGYLRNQRVVRIKLFPVHCSLQDRIIYQYTRIVVKLVFNGGTPAERPLVLRDPEESMYQSALLNYSQARPWRQMPGKTKLRKISQNLSPGEWLKISINKEGIYKVTGQQLAAHGVTLNQINPRNLRLFNNGGRELPESAATPRPDSLIENAILVIDGDDNRFDPEDYLVFYGRGVAGVTFDSDARTFRHYLHHYTDTNCYWLNCGSTVTGQRITTLTPPVTPPLAVKTHFTDFYYSEEEITNILQSGRDWLGRNLRSSSEPLNYLLNLKQALVDSPATLRVRLAAVSFGDHPFFLGLNSIPMQEFSIFGVGAEEPRFNPETFSITRRFPLKDGLNYLNIGYTANLSAANCFVDWYEFEYQRKLVFQNESLWFNSASDSGLIEFVIDNPAQAALQIFEVTDFQAIRAISIAGAGAQLSFRDSVQAAYPKRYVALTPVNWLQVESIQSTRFPTLRQTPLAVDYIIITPQAFNEAAQMIKSLRENMDSLKTAVVTIGDIWDAYGWGLPDPVAIRDFLRDQYLQSQGQLRYVLLLGDGHFDYKLLTPGASVNWIPAFQTTETYAEENRCLDEWFACVAGDDAFLDLSIGRLPARTLSEARLLVEKICHYESTPTWGDWRHQVTMVADDEFVRGGVEEYGELDHTQAAETITQAFPKYINFRKIYLINYPSVRTASVSGITKPGVNTDLVQQINQGTVIWDMIGHSHERQFAHENVFSLTREVPLLKNGARLPLLVVASCAFGRFDHPTDRYVVEELLCHREGGIIASFASTRLAYGSMNVALNHELIRYLFATPQRPLRVGDAVRLAKNATMNSNSQKYHLLGDPALILAIPSERVVIDSVAPDSLKALSVVTVRGYYQPTQAAVTPETGTIALKVFDSIQPQTYTSANQQSTSFTLPGHEIFRGTGKVVAGHFQLQFIVPKDITYGSMRGRMSCYLELPDGRVDAVGVRDDFYIGGTNLAYRDVEGPEITIGFKGCTFAAGGLVPPAPILTALIQDRQSGVNITGEIGHKIVLTLDDLTDQKYDLTSFFNYDENSYLSGKLEYPLTQLSPGAHQLSLKAWDNFNNSETATVSFTISSQDQIVFQRVLNYPNPFSKRTQFTFEISQPAEIRIKIYTVAGHLIRTFPATPVEAGFNFDFQWDGTDELGDQLANGVYLYQIIAVARVNGQSVQASVTEKLIIMH
ncbi:type IX secretion system sortase PorU [candidate division KSB1 bacterium]|nr:type IX secretion system sortase PorU [candidate division KSB1 bacterium]